MIWGRKMQGGLFFGPAAWQAAEWEILPAQIPGTPPAMENPVDLPFAPLMEIQRWALDARLPQTTPWIAGLLEQLRAARVLPRHLLLTLLPMQPESILGSFLSQVAMEPMVLALDRLRQVLGHPQAHVVIDRHDRSLFRRWKTARREHRLQLHALLNRYPQGYPSYLLRSLWRLDLPVGAAPSQAGVLLLDPVTLWALGQALSGQGPFDRRPVEVFVAGQSPRMILAPLGLGLPAFFQALGLSLESRQCLRNGMLSGQLIDPQTSCIEAQTQILALREAPQTESPAPCIRCGWCVDHCPANLNPVELFRRMDGGIPPGQEIKACMECGLCSYVCPSRLPLTQHLGTWRETLTAKAISEGK